MTVADDDVDARLSERYESVLADRMLQALARRIRSRVVDARADPDRASRRWPFELIQNAHDAKQRAGREGISVAFEFVEGRLTFSHDAAPFDMEDLASLLTGGSSKDFDSEETTGRFGTGFLVTHVLSQRAHVVGVLQDDAQFRLFDVELYRPPNEGEILDNITASKVALAHTKVVVDFAGLPTATVTYQVDEPRLALAGLDMLEQCLPYLLASCRRLSEIRIRRDERTTTWRVASRGAASQFDAVDLEEVVVHSEDSQGGTQTWLVVRATRDADARGWLLVALRKAEDGWSVWEPPEAVPRLFRQLPVLGAPPLSTWVVLDGLFDLDQERGNIHVVDEHGVPLRDALDAIGGLAMYAASEGWFDAHRVGQLSMPKRDLGSEAVEVWREALTSAASRLALLPLVETVREGALAAVKAGEQRWVDFIAIEPDTATDHDELWSLAARCTTPDPPLFAVSRGWSEIARGWADLGVEISWLDLPDAGGWAREDAVSIGDLKVTGDPYDWLVCYLDAVGRRWGGGVTVDDVFGLLPDQHQRLHSAGELRRDPGVDERIKDISERVAYDVRSLLVDRDLVLRIEGGDFSSGLNALSEATGSDLSEPEVVDELAKRLSTALPADRPVADKSRGAVAASMQLLGYLWSSLGPGARQVAGSLPFVTRDGAACRVSQHKILLQPVATWPETAQPFSGAFPTSRILDDQYADELLGGPPREAFAQWGIAHDGLLGTARRKELRDRALRAIAVEASEVDDAKPLDCELSQIALLEPEVLNHCKQSRDLARALLGFVVCHVARADGSWRLTRPFEILTPSGIKSVNLTPCLWIADLRSKPWIPVEAAGGVTEHPPSPAVIRDLIDPKWLEGNPDGAELLVRHFEMDALDVQLLAAAPDDASRQAIRDELAKILVITGADPGEIAALVRRAVDRKRDVDRMRALGLAVQARVQAALNELGLDALLVDRGYDFLVTEAVDDGADSADASVRVEYGGFKLEVKTTTAAEVRLTPLQAATAAAEPDVFVLCVVDLRSMKADALDMDWNTVDVGDYCRIVRGASLPVDATLSLVQDAEAGDVPIRNTAALRYAVGAIRWEEGEALNEWVKSAFERELGVAGGSTQGASGSG